MGCGSGTGQAEPAQGAPGGEREDTARTLRLDTTERQHLFRLAEVPDMAPPDHASPLLRPQVQVILDGLNPMPALVVTERFDILVWNAAHAVLLPRTAQVEAAARNTLLYCFSRAECCNVIENREDQRAAMVAQLRVAYGHHVGDPAWTAFIRRGAAAVVPGERAGHGGHGAAGPVMRLEMTSTSFAVQTAAGIRMVVYTPENEATRTARRGSGRVSLPLLAGPPGPGPGTPYDLRTNQVNPGQTRSGYSKLTLSYRFLCSSYEPPITAIQSIILQAQVVTCFIIRNTG